MKDLLPLGSVVSLIDGEKSLMIIGANNIQRQGKVFDYLAVLHPEGYINNDTFFLFNHKDIADVKFLGCVNVETQVFYQMMKDAEKNQKDKGHGGK